MRDYQLWALAYGASDEKAGRALTTAHCSTCQMSVGIVWDHPEFGLIFETIGRDGLVRHMPTARSGGPAFDWQTSRQLAPWPLSEMQREVVATVACPKGHLWQVNLRTAMHNARAGVHWTKVREPHRQTECCNHVHYRFATAAVELPHEG